MIQQVDALIGQGASVVRQLVDRAPLTGPWVAVRIAGPGTEGSGGFVPDPVVTMQPCRLENVGLEDVVRRARCHLLPGGADRIEELAQFAVGLTQASAAAPQCDGIADPAVQAQPSDMQSIAVCLHEYAYWQLPQQESVARRAKRLLSMIVERAAPVDDDHPDLPIFLDFVLGRYVDLDTGRGAFANWAKDTTTDLHRHIRAVFTHEISDARRHYRARMGIPQRLRIEGAADVRNWKAAFAGFVLNPDRSVTEFSASSGHPWSWPRSDELADQDGIVLDDEVWDWAHNCWFRALGDDASEARPGPTADHARISRDVDAFRGRKGAPGAANDSSVPSLEPLAAEFATEWGAVIARLEDLLRSQVPAKFDQIVGLRQITTQRQSLELPSPGTQTASASVGDDPVDLIVDVEREALIAGLADSLADLPPPSGNGLVVSLAELAESLIDNGDLPEPDVDEAARRLGCSVEEFERWWEHVQQCVGKSTRPDGGGQA